MKRKLAIVLVATIVLAGAGLWALSQWSLAALEEPGALERYAAVKVKRWQIARAARGIAAPASKDERAIATGGMQFRADCAVCHGSDGRTPTEIGRWMSPRAPDLATAEVQAWSDAELFWIIKNGIKMTGMPGFGRMHPDQRIWELVHYVRQIGESPPS